MVLYVIDWNTLDDVVLKTVIDKKLPQPITLIYQPNDKEVMVIDCTR